MSIDYSDYIIHIKKSGQKLKKFKCTCDSCGGDRGYLPKAKAFTVCLPCKQLQPEYKEKHKKAIIAVRSTIESRQKTIQQLKDQWDFQRNDPNYILNVKIKNSLRSRLSHALRGNFKSGSAVSNLGCSIDDLKKHLESQFEPWMNWDNYGVLQKNKKTWNIDHKDPLSSFDLTDRVQLLDACRYTNLQPMLAYENSVTKSDRINYGK
jgi:hypothetical protein